MNTKMRLAAAMVCLSMLASLAACNGSPSETSSSQGTVSIGTGTTSSEVSEETSSESTGIGTPVVPSGDTKDKMAEATAINSDVVGWLTINGTNIDYPVLQNPNGKNVPGNQVNQYYLNRDLYKKKSKDACIFVDDWNNIGTREQLDRNTILYGHNWTNIEKNGAAVRMNNDKDVMFGQLVMFSDLEFAKKTPTISFSTQNDEITWVVFAAFYTEESKDFFYINDKPDEFQLMDIVNGATRRSEHIYDVDVRITDKILTLSTCTRRLGNRDDQRFVVMARMLRDGEKVENFAAPIDNPDPLRPSWYKGDR